MTRRGTALAVALATVAVRLLWATRQDGVASQGVRIVLATAGLWWWAALQATWRIWVPVAVVLAGLWLAIPPRRPRRAPPGREPVAEVALTVESTQQTPPAKVLQPTPSLAQEPRPPDAPAEPAQPAASVQPAVPPAIAPPPLPQASPAPEPPMERESTQEPTREAAVVVAPASVPAPIRTVWEAFTVVPRREEVEDGQPVT